MTPEMAQLMNASLLPAVDTAMTSRMGNFWYVAIFFLPPLLVYLKTQNIVLSTIVLFWSVVFYGYLIVGVGMGTIIAIALAIGICIAIWKAWSPSN
jgi:hypothetical protein